MLIKHFFDDYADKIIDKDVDTYDIQAMDSNLYFGEYTQLYIKPNQVGSVTGIISHFLPNLPRHNKEYAYVDSLEVKLFTTTSSSYGSRNATMHKVTCYDKDNRIIRECNVSNVSIVNNKSEGTVDIDMTGGVVRVDAEVTYEVVTPGTSASQVGVHMYPVSASVEENDMPSFASYSEYTRTTSGLTISDTVTRTQLSFPRTSTTTPNRLEGIIVAIPSPATLSVDEGQDVEIQATASYSKYPFDVTLEVYDADEQLLSTHTKQITASGQKLCFTYNKAMSHIKAIVPEIYASSTSTTSEAYVQFYWNTSSPLYKRNLTSAYGIVTSMKSTGEYKSNKQEPTICTIATTAADDYYNNPIPDSFVYHIRERKAAGNYWIHTIPFKTYKEGDRISVRHGYVYDIIPEKIDDAGRVGSSYSGKVRNLFFIAVDESELDMYKVNKQFDTYRRGFHDEHKQVDTVKNTVASCNILHDTDREIFATSNEINILDVDLINPATSVNMHSRKSDISIKHPIYYASVDYTTTPIYNNLNFPIKDVTIDNNRQVGLIKNINQSIYRIKYEKTLPTNGVLAIKVKYSNHTGASSPTMCIMPSSGSYKEFTLTEEMTEYRYQATSSLSYIDIKFYCKNDSVSTVDYLIESIKYEMDEANDKHVYWYENFNSINDLCVDMESTDSWYNNQDGILGNLAPQSKVRLRLNQSAIDDSVLQLRYKGYTTSSAVSSTYTINVYDKEELIYSKQETASYYSSNYTLDIPLQYSSDLIVEFVATGSNGFDLLLNKMILHSSQILHQAVYGPYNLANKRPTIKMLKNKLEYDIPQDANLITSYSHDGKIWYDYDEVVWASIADPSNMYLKVTIKDIAQGDNAIISRYSLRTQERDLLDANSSVDAINLVGCKVDGENIVFDCGETQLSKHVNISTRPNNGTFDWIYKNESFSVTCNEDSKLVFRLNQKQAPYGTKIGYLDIRANSKSLTTIEGNVTNMPVEVSIPKGTTTIQLRAYAYRTTSSTTYTIVDAYDVALYPTSKIKTEAYAEFPTVSTLGIKDSEELDRKINTYLYCEAPEGSTVKLQYSINNKVSYADFIEGAAYYGDIFNKEAVDIRVVLKRDALAVQPHFSGYALVLDELPYVPDKYPVELAVDTLRAVDTKFTILDLDINDVDSRNQYRFYNHSIVRLDNRYAVTFKPESYNELAGDTCADEWSRYNIEYMHPNDYTQQTEAVFETDTHDWTSSLVIDRNGNSHREISFMAGFSTNIPQTDFSLDLRLDDSCYSWENQIEIYHNDFLLATINPYDNYYNTESMQIGNYINWGDIFTIKFINTNGNYDSGKLYVRNIRFIERQEAELEFGIHKNEMIDVSAFKSGTYAVRLDEGSNPKTHIERKLRLSTDYELRDYVEIDLEAPPKPYDLPADKMYACIIYQRQDIHSTVELYAIKLEGVEFIEQPAGDNTILRIDTNRVTSNLCILPVDTQREVHDGYAFRLDYDYLYSNKEAFRLSPMVIDKDTKEFSYSILSSDIVAHHNMESADSAHNITYHLSLPYNEEKPEQDGSDFNYGSEYNNLTGTLGHYASIKLPELHRVYGMMIISGLDRTKTTNIRFKVKVSTVGDMETGEADFVYVSTDTLPNEQPIYCTNFYQQVDMGISHGDIWDDGTARVYFNYNNFHLGNFCDVELKISDVVVEQSSAHGLNLIFQSTEKVSTKKIKQMGANFMLNANKTDKVKAYYGFSNRQMDNLYSFDELLSSNKIKALDDSRITPGVIDYYLEEGIALSDECPDEAYFTVIFERPADLNEYIKLKSVSFLQSDVFKKHLNNNSETNRVIAVDDYTIVDTDKVITVDDFIMADTNKTTAVDSCTITDTNRISTVNDCIVADTDKVIAVNDTVKAAIIRKTVNNVAILTDTTRNIVGVAYIPIENSSTLYDTVKAGGTAKYIENTVQVAPMDNDCLSKLELKVFRRYNYSWQTGNTNDVWVKYTCYDKNNKALTDELDVPSGDTLVSSATTVKVSVPQNTKYVKFRAYMAIPTNKENRVRLDITGAYVLSSDYQMFVISPKEPTLDATTNKYTYTYLISSNLTSGDFKVEKECYLAYKNNTFEYEDTQIFGRYITFANETASSSTTFRVSSDTKENTPSFAYITRSEYTPVIVRSDSKRHTTVEALINTDTKRTTTVSSNIVVDTSRSVIFTLAINLIADTLRKVHSPKASLIDVTRKIVTKISDLTSDTLRTRHISSNILTDTKKATCRSVATPLDTIKSAIVNLDIQSDLTRSLSISKSHRIDTTRYSIASHKSLLDATRYSVVSHILPIDTNKSVIVNHDIQKSTLRTVHRSSITTSDTNRFTLLNSHVLNDTKRAIVINLDSINDTRRLVVGSGQYISWLNTRRCVIKTTNTASDTNRKPAIPYSLISDSNRHIAVTGSSNAHTTRLVVKNSHLVVDTNRKPCINSFLTTDTKKSAIVNFDIKADTLREIIFKTGPILRKLDTKRLTILNTSVSLDSYRFLTHDTHKTYDTYRKTYFEANVVNTYDTCRGLIKEEETKADTKRFLVEKATNILDTYRRSYSVVDSGVDTKRAAIVNHDIQIDTDRLPFRFVNSLYEAKRSQVYLSQTYRYDTKREKFAVNMTRVHADTLRAITKDIALAPVVFNISITDTLFFNIKL